MTYWRHSLFAILGWKGLQARVKDYKESFLYNLLYREHKLVDGFDKEMCIYRSKDFQGDLNMTIEDFLARYIERRIQSVGFLWNKSGGAWQGHFLSENETRSSILQRLLEKIRLAK